MGRKELIKDVAAGIENGDYVWKDESVERVQGGKLWAVHVVPKDTSDRFDIPVVMIHGGQHSSWFYRGLQQVMAAAGIDTYALELQPSRLKPASSNAKDIAAFLNALSLEKAVLVGHSQGGQLIQELLLQNDKNNFGLDPSALVFAGSLAWGKASLIRNLMVDLVTKLGLYNVVLLGLNSRVSTTSGVLTMFASKGAKPTDETDVTGVPIALSTYAKMTMASRPEGLIPLAKWMFVSRTTRKNPAPTVKAPVLVVHFENDNTIHIRNAKYIQKTYGAEFMEAKNLGHCFLEQNWREDFAQPLIEWIKKVGA